MKPIIYFRGTIVEQEEYKAACEYFTVVTNRVKIPKDSLVIPRYSALPFYGELEEDVLLLGSKLINSYAQHNYVADIWNWYDDLKEWTPKTYSNWIDLPQGAYVLKGTTNSRKHNWNTHMFAKTKEEIPIVARKLMEDELIRHQRIVVREYIPLEELGEGINGLPITNEWRFFILNGSVLSAGFYWASEPDCCPGKCMNPPREACELVVKVVEKISHKIPFFVIDVAKTQEGNWIVIELNDGQMSGLSMIDPGIFYEDFASALEPYYFL